MNSRNRDIDFIKFFSAIMIMATHKWIIGVNQGPFFDAWIYVELFLMITGYYTAVHFVAKNYSDPMKESIIYTLKNLSHYVHMYL